MPASGPDAGGPDDTGRIIRFLLVKAAIFIAIPAALAVFAVLVLMP